MVLITGAADIWMYIVSNTIASSNITASGLTETRLGALPDVREG